MKQKEERHPTYRIFYNLHYFKIQEPKIGHITLSFSDESQQCEYVCAQEMKHVSYKTVVTALRRQQEDIVKSEFVKLAADQYCLTVKVCYEFLHNIQERFIFRRGEKLSREQINALKEEKKMVNVMASLKQQLSSLSCLATLSGKINNNPKKIHQIYFKIPASPTIISLSLNLHKMQDNLINVQFYYFDALTKSKIATNMLIAQGMYINNNILQLSIAADGRNFHQGCFTIQGNFRGGDYMITHEAVRLSNPIDKKKIFKGILIAGLILIIFYFYCGWTADGGLEEE